MKATIEIELKPFTVPNFVTPVPKTGRQDTEGTHSIPLSDLDARTLEQMCDEFREAVFTKAGKQRPPTCKPERAS